MPTKKKPAKKSRKKSGKRAPTKPAPAPNPESPGKKPATQQGVDALEPPKLPKRPPSRPSTRRPGQRGPDKGPRKPRKPQAGPELPEAAQPTPGLPRPFVPPSDGVPVLVPPDRPIGAPPDSVVDARQAIDDAKHIYAGQYSTVEQRAAAFSKALSVTISVWCRNRYGEPIPDEDKEAIQAVWEPAAQYYDDAIWSKPLIPAVITTGAIVISHRDKCQRRNRARPKS